MIKQQAIFMAILVPVAVTIVNRAQSSGVKTPSVSVLIDQLKHRDVNVQKRSATTLVKLGSRAVPGLIDALQKEKIDAIRIPSILAQIGEPAIPALVKKLRDPNPTMRVHAINILSCNGPNAKLAVPGIINCLRDPDDQVRKAAVKFFLWIKDDRAISDLIHVLKHDMDKEVRSEVLWGIHKYGPKANKAIPALVKVMKRQSSYADCVWKDHYPTQPGYVASFALAKIGTASAKPLVRMLAEPKLPVCVRVAAAYGLYKMESKAIAIVPQLIPLIHDPNHNIRQEVVEVLGSIGSKNEEVIGALKTATGDRSSNVRLYAAISLSELGYNGEAIPVFQSLLNDRQAHIRSLAAINLGVMGPDAATAVPALIKSLEHDTDNRSSAATALGMIGSKAAKAIPVLQKSLLNEDRKNVRQAMRNAIRQILTLKNPR